MFRCLSLLSILVLATAGAFASERAVEPDANRQQMLRFIADPLPAGAVAKQSAVFYGPDNLYEYMDGAADIFVLYGVHQLLHADLRANSADISVDVFDMGSADSAFGMYAAERSPDSRFIAIGAEGYQYEGMLNFLQDRYYVKLLGFGDGADAVLDTFARALSARIGTNPALPALLSKLPKDNRKPHSEQYMPADPLGHAFLGPAYMVAYTSGDQESKLFVTVARDEADAQQRLKQLEQHFTKTGHCEPAPAVAEGAIRASNSFEGSVIARTKGRYLLLLVNPAKGSEQLLKNAAADLP
jgi:uncharacterized protein DUF6599